MVAHAARVGVSIYGCNAYVTWPPCVRCARLLIQAGIHGVYFPSKLEIPERWEKDFDMSMELMREAGVTVSEVDMNGEQR